MHTQAQIRLRFCPCAYIRHCYLISCTLIILIFSNTNAKAQVSWPKLTKTARPWSRWWWQGSAVDSADLARNLEAYHKAGIGGLEITPIYGVKGYEDRFISFLSPRWMQLFDYTTQLAGSLDMGIDLANATGWPFGGPWVQPDDACKNIQYREWTIHGGDTIHIPVVFHQSGFYRSESHARVSLDTLLQPIARNKQLQAYAFDQVRFDKNLKPFLVLAQEMNTAATLVLTGLLDSDGMLHWRAPAGDWQIQAYFMGFHGKMVERAAPGGEGDVIDHFSRIAVEHYLAHFDSAFHYGTIDKLRSFFNDSYEVDDARGQSNWTPDFLKQFRQYRNYDLQPYLSRLLHRDSSDTGRRVLMDYRTTISDLLLNNFTEGWVNWAHKKHKLVRNQSHGSPANILDLYAAVDIPETEGTDILRYKFASSAANITGKPLVSSETATWLGEHFQSTWGDVQHAVNGYFLGGVNHIFWHGIAYSPFSDPWPGWLFYAAVHFQPTNPQWTDFAALNRYVTRCQQWLQQGRSDNPVLLYYPYYDRLAQPDRDLLQHFDGMNGFEHTLFDSSAQWLLQKGYDFDLITDRQLSVTYTTNDVIHTSGNQYKILVLSDVSYLPLKIMEHLEQLAEGGAQIVFLKKLPSKVPGLYRYREQETVMRQTLSKLHWKTTAGGYRKAAIGKGYFYWGNDLQPILQDAQVERELMTDAGLQYVRRKLPGGHLYFIRNTGAINQQGWVTLGSPEDAGAIYDPFTGITGKARMRKQAGKQQVWLELAAGATCIVRTQAVPIQSALFPYYRIAGEAIKLKAPWRLHFESGGPEMPGDTIIRQPVYWTDFDAAIYKDFSGTVVYRTDFNWLNNKAPFIRIQPGNISATASVWLNGKKIATLFGTGQPVIIPVGYLQAHNILEVKVSSTMANRIAYMDRKAIPWKKFYNTNFPARLPANRDGKGLFTAEKWRPEPAGMDGEMELIPMRLYHP